ncbi:MAG TPA: redoxin domain-containing protein [Terriglobales bacterium]|nr:redoxin domain-containing protein [Terriglobales bacterium]
MSQAEIAGGRVSPKAEVPRIGYRLRDFMLRSTAGAEVRLSDYRARSNLILIFGMIAAQHSALIRDVAAQYQRIREQQAEVLLISPTMVEEPQRPVQLPFPVLLDAATDLC